MGIVTDESIGGLYVTVDDILRMKVLDSISHFAQQPNPLDIWVSEEVFHHGSVIDERADEIEMTIAFKCTKKFQDMRVAKISPRRCFSLKSLGYIAIILRSRYSWPFERNLACYTVNALENVAKVTVDVNRRG